MNNAVAEINNDWLQRAEAHQNVLTKPPGSLGRLETIAVRLSAMQASSKPVIEKIQITVFASDHGIANEGVSAFPQAVTLEMVKNFASGGAAISVLAKELGAELEVINLGTVADHDVIPGVMNQRIAPGTNNFSQQAAMSFNQLVEAFESGRETIARMKNKSMQLFIGGDMGIANTTSATAIACALLKLPAEMIVGPGTGLNAEGVKHKAKVINESLGLHASELNDPVSILQSLGGFEIAALTAAYVACAQEGIPVLVDGFIASAAALAAVEINPQVKNWLFFSHSSAEPGHKKMMEYFDEVPLLDLGMRLGEGSGAAIAVSLLKHACALHNGMATFEQAGVSNKDG
ncbi:MAG: nicotinate-nucleotide--dimethylbenzimidazole phosphoribosyltransferase [Gammaproteobacteria bacterium]|nr:nicotinate-nucleotide--dimethylbenzimidazole phosphoribosyltransferase [Gammaproteobacteria bacterium]